MGKNNNKFDWTDYVTLKEYFDTRLEAIDKATATAYRTMERRLAGMNEFRETLKDQAGRFITRNEMNSELEVMKANIKILELSKAKLEGKADMSTVYISYILSFVGIIMGLISLIIKFT